MKIKNQSSFRQTLTEEFTRIRWRNPAFSLRAFAKRCGIQPPALSQILSGKRRVSAKLAKQILDRLAIEPTRAAAIVSQMDASPEISYKLIDMDRYHMISDWYHFPLLSLIETADFKPSPTWIGRRLGISKLRATNALSRLKRLGFIKVNQDKSITLSQPKFMTSDNISSLAIRDSHAQHLELAKEALFEDNIDLRDITTLSLAIDVTKMELAKQMIRQFRETMAQVLESDHQTEVYDLCIQLFPVSKKALR